MTAHPQADREWSDLLQRRSALRTTSYVLLETLALLQHRLGMDSVRAFTRMSCPVSFEVMRRHGLDTAFCFDPNFAEQGFGVLPAVGTP